MKILHILAEDILCPRGGLGVAVNEITRETSKLGFENTILGFNHLHTFGSITHNHDRRIINANLNHHNMIGEPLSYYQKVWFGMINSLAHVLGKEQFDLIHLHDHVCYRIADMARHLYKCSVAATVHLSFSIDNQQNDPVSMHDHRQETNMMQEFNISTVSHAYAKKLINYHTYHKDITVIPNGISTSSIDAALPKEIGEICKNRIPVYFCGRMVPTKGIELVIEAAAACPEYHFLVFSNTSLHVEDVSALVRKVKSAHYFLDNFTWMKAIGFQEQFGYLKASKIALLPTINEAPFEITGLEAMAAGVPLITTGKCGISEYANSTNSVIFEPDAKSLIKVLKSFVRDENKIQNAHATAKQFTWSLAAKRYASWYHNIITKEDNYAKQNFAA